MSELLAELFSSRVRAAVLSLLLPRPHLGFSLTELSRRLGLPVSSLQHECYKLTRLGLLRTERSGSARLYRPDVSFPLLQPLTDLTLRSMPLPEALMGAIEAVPGVASAWIAGDFATPGASVFLVVVGNLGIEELDGVFARARLCLAPHVGTPRFELAYYRPADWSQRLATADPFVTSLLTTRQITLVPEETPQAAESTVIA